MRKLLVIANWKCNPTTLQKAKKLFNLVKRGVENLKNIEVVICPPFLFLPPLICNEKSSRRGLEFGGQDVFWEEKGAFTGEVSPKMLKGLGLKYVIIGHSERRNYQKETDEVVNKKIKAALKEKLRPILCVDKISQIKKGLRGLSKKELRNLAIAYEPLFAIGTGKPCSVEKAKKMNFSIKRYLGREIPLLYGGSVNSQNARDYIKEGKFQGLLVGGASLNPKEFLKIIKLLI